MPKKRKHGNVMAHRLRGRGGMKRRNDAERRRRALRAFMLARDLTPASWAKKARLKNPNSLYNFLNGRSDSLSAATLEKLAGVEMVNVSSLLGDSVVPSDRGIVTLKVIGTVEAGRWGEAAEFPADEQRVLTLTASRHYGTGRIYGLVVNGTSMNRLYPPGTILECMDLADWEERNGSLPSGKKVIVHRRNREGEIEATCKEIQFADGLAWLWPRSDDPAWQQPFSTPWPPSDDAAPRKDGVESITITAVVIRAISDQ